MYRTAIKKSVRLALPAFALSLVALAAVPVASPSLSAAQNPAPTVIRSIVSAGRSTPFTEFEQIDKDLQADRIGDLFGAAFMDEGGDEAAFLPALRSLESQFDSVQVLPKTTKYCYEYDPKTGRIYVICKETRAASIVESPGDNPVELHLEVSIQL